VKPVGILLKQETVSSSGISWATCKPAPSSRQITTPAPHHSVFTGRMIFLLPNQQRQSTEGRSSDTKCSSKHSNKLRHGETIICPHRSQQIYVHAQKDPQSAQLRQPGLRAACLAGPGGLRDGQRDRQMDGLRHHLTPPYGGGIITTTILQPSYRPTCVCRHLQLRTGEFCYGAKFYCPHALSDGNQHIQTGEKTLEFS